MTVFSKEEFHVMVDQLLHQTPVCFDMLCHIAEKTLRGTVRHWCNQDKELRSARLEEDVMQAIHVKLIKYTISKFLLRSADGRVNLDPDGFQGWMFTVAKNVKRDQANEVRRLYFNSCSLEDDIPEDVPDYGAQDENDQRERLSAAFDIVLNADVQVYKVLTWLAQCLFMVQQDVTKIQSNDLILEAFEQETLYRMRDMLFAAVRTVPWVQIQPEQIEKIDGALAAPYDDRRCYGQVTYQEFFMKKGGKATISDWVNRMNSMIKRVMADEACNS